MNPEINNSKVAVIGSEYDKNVVVPSIAKYGFEVVYVNEKYDASRSIEDYVQGATNIVARSSYITGARGSKITFLEAAKSYSSGLNIFSPLVTLIADDADQEEAMVNEYTAYMLKDLITSYVYPNKYMSREIMQDLFVGNATRAKWEKDSLSNRILLVEDDEMVTDQYEMTLRTDYYKDKELYLDIAHDTKTAIEMMRAKDYRVAILDKNLPGSTQMDVYDLASWIDKVFPFTRTILTSGDARYTDKEYFKQNIVRKPALPDIALGIAQTNIEISKKMIYDAIKDSHGKIYLLVGGRGEGKTTFADIVLRSLPWTYKPKRLVSRYPPRNEVDLQDHDFVKEQEILDHRGDPNWIVFPKKDNDGSTYWAGLDLSKVDAALRKGKDILIPLADPNKAEIFYERYGYLVETMLIHNPDPKLVSQLVEERDKKPFSPKQVMEDQKKYSVFKRPHIIPNILDPFKEMSENKLKDPLELAQSGYLDNWVEILSNKIRLDRQSNKRIYNVPQVSRRMARKQKNTYA